MFTTLSDIRKGEIFTVLALSMALGVALLVRVVGPSVMIVWSLTPTIAALVMMLVVTKDGYSKDGWRALGLRRLGVKVWWIAAGATFLVSLVSSVIVWLTPFSSFLLPKDTLSVLLNFAVTIVFLALTFALSEEIGMRGYLLPKLLSLGRTRALGAVGLVHATWHMPLIFLTTLYHTSGNKLIVLPLFVGTIVAASFVFGYLRIYTDSVWPASIGHAVHNAAWFTLAAFTAKSSSVVVSEYLAGDNGVLILITAAAAAVWLSYYLKRGLDKKSEARDLMRDTVPVTI